MHCGTWKAHLLTGLALAPLLGVPTLAQQYQSPEIVSERVGGKPFSPYAGRIYPTHVLWGDQHLHTEISVDAGTLCRLGQEDAYRFARGEEVTSTTGVRAKLSQPLDWLVISDHADRLAERDLLLGRMNAKAISGKSHTILFVFSSVLRVATTVT